MIGINLPCGPPLEYGGGAGVAPPTASMHYGGAVQPSGALVIALLATDENRDGIDFTAPRQ